MKIPEDIRKYKKLLTSQKRKIEVFIKKFYTLIVIFMLGSTVPASTIIKQGEVGVVTRFGRATGREINPDLNWKIPFAEGVVKMDSRIKRTDITAGVGMKDLQTVNSNIVFNYHISGTDASVLSGPSLRSWRAWR